MIMALGVLTSCEKMEAIVSESTPESSITYELHINYNYATGYYQLHDDPNGTRHYFGTDSTQGVKVFMFEDKTPNMRLYVNRYSGRGTINVKFLNSKTHIYKERKMTADFWTLDLRF